MVESDSLPPRRALRRRTASLAQTETDRRAQRLISSLTGNAEDWFTTRELAQMSGFPSQSLAVALTALRARRLVQRRYDPKFRALVWSHRATNSDSRGPTGWPTNEALYSIAEAAEVAGRSSKAIERRVDRGTMARGLSIDVVSSQRRISSEPDSLETSLRRPSRSGALFVSFNICF